MSFLVRASMEIEEGPIYTAVLARDNKKHKFIDYTANMNGQEIGKLQVIIDHEDGMLEANHVKVVKEFRKQGIAKALYNYAAKAQGKKFRPSTSQTNDGEDFWKSKVI